MNDGKIGARKNGDKELAEGEERLKEAKLTGIAALRCFRNFKTGSTKNKLRKSGKEGYTRRKRVPHYLDR
jgi:hypothetical protein